MVGSVLGSVLCFYAPYGRFVNRSTRPNLIIKPPYEKQDMTNTDLDTCHCIIRHPDAAKFLVVKHEENWAPPVLKFPSGNIDYRVAMINQGLFDKYGLKTRVLRTIQHAPNYHCIEMELASPQPAKKLQAVWVDQAEYLRTRAAQGKLPDPFAIWFEQQATKPAGQRPPFHQPGWFDQASHWIDFRLDSLGVQAHGTPEQFRQGVPASCLLRVGSIDGWIYFKTSHGPGANEAGFLAAMSARWPQTLFKPLAVDTRRNWMLNRDYFKGGKPGSELEQLQPFYAAMAKLQIDSLNYLDDLSDAGCQQLSLADLSHFCRQADQHQNRWQEGGGGLKDAEFHQFRTALQSLTSDFEELAGIGLPMMLVHADFRAGKMVLSGADHRIIDWAGAVISHPFMTLLPLIRQSWSDVNANSAVGISLPQPLLDDIQQHYLPAFAEFAPVDVLLRALELTVKLEPVWRMLRKLQSLDFIEPLTPYYYFQVVSLQAIARQLGKSA